MRLAHLLMRKSLKLITWTGGSMVKKNNIIKGSVYHYRYIDHGAQYRVYVIFTADGESTHRVIKVPLTFEESRRVLEPHLKGIGLDDAEIEKRTHQLMLRKQQLPKLIQGISTKDKKLMQSLGDLKLVPLLVTPQKDAPGYVMPLYFTQDHVMPMAEFMHTFRFMNPRSHKVTLSDVRRARQLFRAMVELHYRLWSYGIADMTFKLENIGIVIKDGKIKEAVLVDGAEHTYDLTEANGVVAEKKWRNCLNPSKTDHLFLPMILHEEYAAIMQKHLTKEMLEKHWQKRSIAIERRRALYLRARQLVARDAKERLRIWMERQNLHEELHQGMPRNRIDMTNIPYADLLLLLDDTRAGKMPLDAVANQEKAERAMYATSDQSMIEIYRHTLHVSRDVS